MKVTAEGRWQSSLGHRGQPWRKWGHPAGSEAGPGSPRWTVDAGSEAPWLPLPELTSLAALSFSHFPWSSLSPQLRASVHRVFSPSCALCPSFHASKPSFLLVSDGCQVLKAPRHGLIPASHTLTVSGCIQDGFPQTASSVRKGLGPAQLISKCRMQEGTRMHYCQR